MRALRWSLLIFLLAASPAPDSALPRSSAAIKAITKRDDSVNRAADVYREAVRVADRLLVSELKDAERVAMRQGDLAEANAIDARLKAATSELAENDPPALSIIGSWGYGGHDTADDTFWADGSVTCVWWNGRKGRWSAVDGRTFRMVQPDGPAVTMTLTSDGKYSLWIYGDGKVNYALRHLGTAK